VLLSGSAALASWAALLGFWSLLALAVATGELRARGAALFLVLWAVGYFGLPRVGISGSYYVTPYLAILAVCLVFIVFKGDVRLR